MDLDKIIEINMKCLPEHYPRFFWLEHLRKWNKAFFVAEINEEIVGYVMCRVEIGIGHIKPWIRKLGHVISIAVLEKFRRRGIGKALMISAMNALKKEYNVSEVYLEVRISNIPAIRLYEQLGFKKVKIIKSYYLDGEDAYVMAKEL
ncbi:MAG: ribosomal-protein-alanine N-acetyltransferase [Thermoprotei archaeon]|nr:MAG: ribosomal-protein-alanine N-acetyltransferase [Thermoprotei archaeon]